MTGTWSYYLAHQWGQPNQLGWSKKTEHKQVWKQWGLNGELVDDNGRWQQEYVRNYLAFCKSGTGIFI